MGESRSIEEDVTNLVCLKVSKRSLEHDGWEAAGRGRRSEASVWKDRSITMVVYAWGDNKAHHVKLEEGGKL